MTQFKITMTHEGGPLDPRLEGLCGECKNNIRIKGISTSLFSAFMLVFVWFGGIGAALSSIMLAAQVSIFVYEFKMSRQGCWHPKGVR